MALNVCSQVGAVTLLSKISPMTKSGTYGKYMLPAENKVCLRRREGAEETSQGNNPEADDEVPWVMC